MTILLQTLTALPISILIGTLFTRLFESRTSVVRLPLFFLAVFLGAWIGGFWVIPMEDALWAVYWIPFFAAGLLVGSFVIAISMTSVFRESAAEAAKDSTERTRKFTKVEGLLWILNVFLVVSIVVIISREQSFILDIVPFTG